MRPTLRPDQYVRAEEMIRRERDRALLATFDNVDFQRARFWALTAAFAVNFPRRLGQDASPRELVFDTRISRKICAGYLGIWKMIHQETDAPPPPDWREMSIMVMDPIMTQIGATVIWERQIEVLILNVNARMKRLTEFEELARMDGMKKWYHRRDTFLEWELDALERTKSFMVTKRPT